MNARDIRGSASYREAHDFYAAVRRPGTDRISDLIDLDASPDGSVAVFTAFIAETLDEPPISRIAHIDLLTGETRMLTAGPFVDRLPRYSPDGNQVAFLSDRNKPGDFQLHLLDPHTDAIRAAPTVDGWVEYLHWSPDGGRILLGVAGHGADVAGGQGAVTSKPVSDGLPSWLPHVDAGDGDHRWRRAWIYDLDDGSVRQVGSLDRNVWEAIWCGDGTMAAIVSPEPGEGAWYTARLAVHDLAGDHWRELYRPADQLGWPAASPDGHHLALVEAICSDRGIVAGDLRLIDVGTGTVWTPDTGGVDITYLGWRDNRRLLAAGHRGLETVVGLYDVATERFDEIWASDEIGMAGRYARVSGVDETGDCVVIGEGFKRSPEVAVIRSGRYRSVKSFDLGYAAQASAIAAIDEVRWTAPDGLAMEGWLLRPEGEGPHPLVMNIHGGPVLLWRPMWLGRSRYAPLSLLVRHGYAVFLPNPRGSSGRGQDFARRVVGAMGDGDAQDCLSGLDHLVARGVADPSRLGVTGVSYGGFMTCWLITQDMRFAAAVPIAPITNFVTEHLLSNISHFVTLFAQDRIGDLGGRYHRYSPVLHADKVTTPTLTICGMLDRCTPPEEAIQFHNALLEHGVRSTLARYPEEGHGIETMPAAIDFAARLIDWFEEFMPSGTKR